MPSLVWISLSEAGGGLGEGDWVNFYQILMYQYVCILEELYCTSTKCFVCPNVLPMVRVLYFVEISGCSLESREPLLFDSEALYRR